MTPFEPINEPPKAILNVKNVKEGDREMWVRESKLDVETQIVSGVFISVHRQLRGEWHPVTINRSDIVTVEDYS